MISWHICLQGLLFFPNSSESNSLKLFMYSEEGRTTIIFFVLYFSFIQYGFQNTFPPPCSMFIFHTEAVASQNCCLSGITTHPTHHGGKMLVGCWVQFEETTLGLNIASSCMRNKTKPKFLTVSKIP